MSGSSIIHWTEIGLNTHFTKRRTQFSTPSNTHGLD